MTRRRSNSTETLALLLLASISTVGCDDEPPVTANVALTDSPLIEDRTFAATLITDAGVFSGPLGPRSAVWDSNDGFVTVLSQGCETIQLDRFADPTHFDPPADHDDAVCGGYAARDQQIALCMGYRFLSLSQALAPYEITDAGDFRQAPLDGTLGEDVDFVVPPPDASDAASLALIAVTYFQDAALRGASILDPAVCADGKLDATVPAGLESGEGHTGPSGDRVTLGFVMASATVEALHLLDDASKRATELISSAAAERMATELDSQEANRQRWRAGSNSRLEIVEMMHGIPARLNEPEPGVDAGMAEPPNGDYPVLDTRAETEVDRRAEALLRSLRVDPRLDGMTLYGAVHDALEEDFPETFDGAPSDHEEFLEHLGIEPSAIRQAALRLEREAAVLGRPMLDLGSNRVTGTRAPVRSADPAYLFATSTGAGAFEEADDTVADTHAPTAAYASRGVLPTVDAVGVALERAQGRTDLNGEAATLSLLTAGLLAVRETVPMRLQVSIGEALTPPAGLDELRVRLYGADVDHSNRYELWLGEAGLECATRYSVEGEPCNPADYRIDVMPSVGTDGIQSGFGARYLEWEIDPGYGEIQETDRIYLTQGGSPRVPLAGWTAHAGTDDDGFTRTSFYPVGPAALGIVEHALAPDLSEVFDPEAYCHGIRRSQRLPLEDELTDDTNGIESSFRHYLTLAHQAAQEADTLGRDIIEQGLERDRRAEDAREELERICGDAINVATFGRSPDDCTCAMGDECPGGCGPGYQCRKAGSADLFRCYPTDFGALITDGPEHDSLRRCLGSATDRVDVGLGNTPLCTWRRDEPGRAPCQCEEGETCPEPINGADGCPTLATADSDCGTMFTTASGFVANDPTDYINLVERRDDGPRYSECEILARVRSRLASGSGTDLELNESEIADVLQQGWLSQERFRTVGEQLIYRQELFQMAALTRGGTRLLETGSQSDGPRTSFPCAAATFDGSDDACASGRVPEAGRSLLCGFGDCEDPGVRIQANQRMLEAAWAIRILGRSRLIGADVFPVPIYGTPTWLIGGEARSGTAIREPAQIPTCTVDSCQASLFPAYDRLLGCYAGWSIPSHCTPGGDCEIDSMSGLGTCTGGASIRTSEPIPTWFATAYSLTGQVRFPNGDDSTAQCVELDAMQTVSSAARAAIGPARCPVYLTRRGLRFDGEDRTPAHVVADRWRPSVSTAATIHALIDRTYRSGLDGAAVADLPGIREVRSTSRLTNALVWDALELACYAQTSPGGSCSDVGDEPPTVRSVEDFPLLRSLLDCAANDFDRKARGLILPDVPRVLVDDLRDSTLSSTAGSYRGEYGSTVEQLRSALQGMGAATDQVSAELRGFAGEVLAAESSVAQIDIQKDINEWETWSAQLNAALQVTSSSLFSGGPAAGFASIQIGIQERLGSLREELLEEQTKLALTQLGIQFSQRMGNIATALRNFTQAYAETSRLLNELDRQRSAARRAVARMLGFETDDVGREWNANRDLRIRFDSTQARYDHAHRSAVQYAALARRAIEQRLGVDMSRMTSPMTLVPPPATWADRVCTLRGVDYTHVAETPEEEGDALAEAGYVGWYVNLLEQFIESYRLDYPFQNASDAAVISLRDDIHRVRTECDEQGANLLLWSSDPTRVPEDGAPGWRLQCEEEEACLSTSPSGLSPFVTNELTAGGGGISTRSARRLGGAQAVTTTLEGSTGEPAWVAPEFEVGSRTFLFSWYELIEPGDTECPVDVPMSPRLEVALTGLTLVDTPEGGSTGGVTAGAPQWVPTGTTEDPVDPWLDCHWRRAFVVATTDVAQPIRAELRLAPGVTSLTWGAPQAEEHRPTTDQTPTPFFPTDDDLLWTGLCEDVHGELFRTSAYWQRRCEQLCTEGFGPSCTRGGADPARERCFYESRFTIALDDIEEGDLVPSGVLALGNFNYRFDTLGVSVVGVGVRDCSDTEQSSACYASAFVPYSLRHEGPYRVRNHQGDIYDARLFVGNIEQGKALAAERYLTNPLSSTDRTLLSDYLHTEFRGRPLDGHYRLRIYEAPGFQ